MVTVLNMFNAYIVVLHVYWSKPMSTLVLDTPDYQLSLQQELLHIAHPQLPTRVYPLSALERLVIGRGVMLSSDLPLKLSELGKTLVLLGHKSSAVLLNSYNAPNDLKLIQYKAVIDEQWRKRLVTLLLHVRWRGQNRVLKKLSLPLLQPLNVEPATNLMLLEAQASHQYWRCWAQRFHKSGFNGRLRRPATDPINALLSLTSTLEDQALIKPLLAEGFDLSLGFHHVTGYRRASLVLDIKEMTRADLEMWISVNWINGTFNDTHFEQTQFGCKLNKVGQKIFYAAWFRWQKKRKTHLRRLIRLCRLILEREARDV